MNHACANCGHHPDDHEGSGCTETLHTLWGFEVCGCSQYVKETDD